MVARFKPKEKVRCYVPREFRDNMDYMDAGVTGCIVNTARKNHWRVAAWLELEDLIQEGRLCYAKCRSRFVPKHKTAALPHPEDRRRFQAYFQRSFQNTIVDLANARTATPEVQMASLGDESSALETLMARVADFSDADVTVLLRNAPAEIVEMLKAILIDLKAEGPHLKSRLRKKTLPGSPVPRIISGRWISRRETTAHYYDRCLGMKDVIKKLREYFGSEAEMDSITS